MRESAAGFTLIEWVVVLAVIALLAGLIGPGFMSRLANTKVEAAQRDVTVIGEAIDQLYVHLEVWPARNAAGTDHTITTLVSGASLPVANPWGDSSYWAIVSGGAVDLIDNQLWLNKPAGTAAASYPISGFKAWHGPYLEHVRNDPWGRPYVVNVNAGYSTDASSHRRLRVLSAGPDGSFQTPATAGLNDVVSGDDIGFLVALR